jgi:hypothetical protein
LLRAIAHKERDRCQHDTQYQQDSQIPLRAFHRVVKGSAPAYAGALERALLSTLLLPRRTDTLAFGLHWTLVVALGLLLLIRAAAARAQAQRHKHAQ